MADLLTVIVPSRGRPAAIADLISDFWQTCESYTRLWFMLDEDDPCLPRYRSVIAQAAEFYGERAHERGLTRRQAVRWVTWIQAPSKSMVEALDAGAEKAARKSFAIGFMGDDHRPRTKGWDAEYLDALRELGTGIVYGDDLLQGANLPTQCAMTADIVRELGYMAPPTLRHMYVDNFWLDLGQAADCIRYLPEVVVEHMHPIAGKADWDDGYKRVNDHAVYDADAEAYHAYRQSRFAADVAKVQALRTVVAAP